jgi:hypothetical protein
MGRTGSVDGMGKWSFKTPLKNHLQKCAQDAVLVRRALHLTASCSRFTPNLKKLAQCSPDEVLAGFGPVYREGNNTSKMTPKIHPTRRCPRNPQMPSKSTWTSQIHSPNRLGPAKSTHALEMSRSRNAHEISPASSVSGPASSTLCL